MAVTTQKCSERRVMLLRIQQYVQELIQINEMADATIRGLNATGEGPVAIATIANKILAAGGPPTDISIHNNGTLSDHIQYKLGAFVGWEYKAE